MAPLSLTGLPAAGAALLRAVHCRSEWAVLSLGADPASPRARRSFVALWSCAKDSEGHLCPRQSDLCFSEFKCFVPTLTFSAGQPCAGVSKKPLKLPLVECVSYGP